LILVRMLDGPKAVCARGTERAAATVAGRASARRQPGRFALRWRPL
jgi:hypothetical protein